LDKSEFGKTTLPDLQLRQAAETQLSNVYLRDLAVRPAEILLHELQVHQVELEMQNETLRQAQIDLEESRDRYVDLYEFTPLGYLTLTSDGLISEINLTGARLLGVERKRLLQKCFTTFVIPEDRDHWITQYLSVTKQGGQGGLDCRDRRTPLAPQIGRTLDERAPFVLGPHQTRQRRAQAAMGAAGVAYCGIPHKLADKAELPRMHQHAPPSPRACR